jgi:hypothetical protein
MYLAMVPTTLLKFVYHLWNFKSVFNFYCFFPPNPNTHSAYVLCVFTKRLNDMYKNVPWCILTKKRRKRWIQLPWMNMLDLCMEIIKWENKVGSLKLSTFYKNQWKKVKYKKRVGSFKLLTPHLLVCKITNTN